MTQEYFNGLKDAVDCLIDEFKCCQMEYSFRPEILKPIKSAFMMAVILIEDKAIIEGNAIKRNYFLEIFIEETK